ncbi:MAG: SdrD B-like domain-containing protein [Propionibacteriaceae bacterium]|nr:SdrD B-like domain-containing protein [Propionibacteriaceae bacterium]
MQSTLLSRASRRALAAVTGLLMVPSMFVITGAAQEARAEENPGIVFSDLKLEETNNDGVVINDGKLDIGSRLKFSMSYDASKANAKPGDSFTILAPSYLQLREEGTFPMKAADGTAAGSCELKLLRAPSGQPWYKNTPQVTCTFGEAIKGMHDVAGTVEIGMAIDDISTSEIAEITINGKVHTTPLPYDKPIGPTAWKSGSGAGKWASTPRKENTRIWWTIYAGGPWLTANYAPGESVTIVDRVGPGHRLATNPGTQQPGTLSEICPDQSVPHGYNSVEVARVNKDLGKGFTLAMQENAEGTEMEVRYSGPFKAECNYNLGYETVFPDGAAITPGQSYDNSGEFVGKSKKVSAKAHYVQTFDATIRYRKGFGSFKVVKLVSGAGFPADQKFDVTINYELPEGKTPADYPDWKAPSNPTKYTVAVGIGTTYEETFPEGTKVTITEEVISANPAPETGLWGDYRFASGEQGVTIARDGRSATFAIVDQKAVALELTNTWLPKEFAPFMVTKSVVPVGVGQGLEFPVTYECDSMGNRNTPASGKVTIRPGESTTVGEFPVGTSCRITGEDDVMIADHSIVSKDLGQALTIAKGGPNTVTVTNTYSPNEVPVSVGDHVWRDENRNGLQDEGETPVADVKVTLKDAEGKELRSTTTNVDGYYFFADLVAGEKYQLTFTAPEGAIFTTRDVTGGDDAKDSDVDEHGNLSFTAPAEGRNEVGPGKADNPTLDAGVIWPKVSVGDRVWWDDDRDGQQDEGEKPVPGVTVVLQDADGVRIAETTTDENGWYAFADLLPSTEYRMLFTLPNGGASWTVANQGDDAADSDVDPSGGVRFTTPANGRNEVAPGKADDPTIDAGVVKPAPGVEVPSTPEPPVTRPGLPKTGS